MQARLVLRQQKLLTQRAQWRCWCVNRQILLIQRCVCKWIESYAKMLPINQKGIERSPLAYTPV